MRVSYLLQALLCLFVVFTIMAPPPLKRRRIVLSLEKKRDIIEKMEAGWSIPSLAQTYDVPNNTLYDLRKNKERIMQYQLDFGKKTTKNVPRKVISKPRFASVDEATLTWFKQQRAAGVLVRGTEVLNAAEKFAQLQGVKDFKASEGWLFRFKRRHGLSNRKAHGEALDCDESGLEDFRQKFSDLISKEGLLLSQIYNADETGLFYRSTPTNTLASEEEKKIPGRKLSKQRVSALCGANATGLHRLKPVIVGKAKQPRCLRGVMDRLPVVWFHSKKAWFTTKIFSEWFHNHFVPEVISFQTKELKVARGQVRALLLLDNAPAHPAPAELVAENGRIRVMYLPPNTTALLQPMDQGVIVSAKRHYRRRFLDEVMVVLEDEEEKMLDEDTRGERTLENLRRYDIKSAIYNWASAWRDVPAKTLENAWSHLLRGTEVECNFLGFEVNDFQARFCESGDAVDVDDVREWLDDDGGDPGYQFLSDAEIAATSSGYNAREDDADDSDEDENNDASGAETQPIPRLSHVRSLIEDLLSYVEHPDADKSIATNEFGDTLRCVHAKVILRQNRRTYRQSTLDTFFRPQPPAQRTASRTVTIRPSTSASPDHPLSATSPCDVNQLLSTSGHIDTTSPLVLLHEGSGESDSD